MAILKENIKTICRLVPSENNPRNSEGDFIRLNDGRIMYAFSRYSGDNWDDHCPCSIAAIFSDDNGETFSEEPVILIRASEFGEKNVMSVSLLKMQNGDTGVFFILKRPYGTIEYYLKRSNDDCKSFYGCVKCIPEIFDGYYVTNNNRVIRTSGNRIIIPASLHRVANKEGELYFDGRAVSYFYYSDDDGYTWKEAPGCVYMPDGKYTDTGLQEAGVVELDNCLYAYFRTDMYAQYESISIDGGMNWTTAQPSKFTSPTSPMKITYNPYLSPKKYYSIWNPIPIYNGRGISPYGWGRAPIVIAESPDGLNFDPYITLDDDPERGYCYPAMYFLDAETALVAYCSGGVARESICLTGVTIKKIKFT